ncbi:MAG: murein biosynthesis integral membrane protein MurJ [Vampirovibrionales bacterium]|nr:murein biosynthesis integral membrane protein MurJ [Vampirovibrionales bacterium]
MKQQQSKEKSLLHAAGLIAFVTILSKLLGAVRDWAIAYVYGTSMVSDAYFAGFQIPSFAIVLLGGLGGPFHTVSVSVFSKLIARGQAPDEKTRQLAHAFITLTAVVFTVFSALTYWYADSILNVLLPGAKPELITLAAAQMRIMSPTLIIGGLVGIFYGFLNIYNSFFWPSFSPALMSLVLLAALWVFPHDPTGHILGWATLGGAIAQFACQLPSFAKYKIGFRPNFNWKRPEIAHINELLFPATIGTTIGQLITYVDMFFTSQLRLDGAWSAITLSNRLLQFPIGVLQTALLVPIFPRFSRLVGEENWPELKRQFKLGVISLWMISIPMLVIMLFYMEGIIRLVFEHGNFKSESTALVTQALLFQAFQMIPYFARDSLTRVFYAFHDSKTPLIIGVVAIGIKALLNALLVGPFDVGGITFATSLITFINMTLLAILSKRHIQDLGFQELAKPFAMLMGAGIVMSGGIWLLELGLSNTNLAQLIPNPTLFELGRIILGSLLGCVIYLICTLAFKIPEAQYLFERISGPLARRLHR